MWPRRPRAFNAIKLIIFTEFLFGLFIAISLRPLAALDLRNAPDPPSNLQYSISVRAHRCASPAAAPAAPLLTIEHTHELAVARSSRCSTHASHPLSLLILSPQASPATAPTPAAGVCPTRSSAESTALGRTAQVGVFANTCSKLSSRRVQEHCILATASLYTRFASSFNSFSFSSYL